MILRRELLASLYLAAMCTVFAGCGPMKITGIAECDEYLASYKSCLKHIPDDRKQAFQDHLDRTRAVWTAMSKNPGTRPALGQACSLARDSAKLTMGEYRCSW